MLAVVPTCMLLGLAADGAAQRRPRRRRHLQSAFRWFFGHALGATLAMPSLITLANTRRLRQLQPLADRDGRRLPGWW